MVIKLSQMHQKLADLVSEYVQIMQSIDGLVENEEETDTKNLVSLQHMVETHYRNYLQENKVLEKVFLDNLLGKNLNHREGK